ncbi:hypothetical protein EON65_26135 [archaeon]|nr:MAG: hypothetical protein EON65_26135 [archaeon]
MSYERCVRKKLRSLFEYLDTDNDGRITPENLLRGLNQLDVATYPLVFASPEDRRDGLDHEKDIKLYSDACEYNVEELIRYANPAISCSKHINSYIHTHVPIYISLIIVFYCIKI